MKAGGGFVGAGAGEGEGLLYAAYLILAGCAASSYQKNLQCKCAQMVRTAENTCRKIWMYIYAVVLIVPPFLLLPRTRHHLQPQLLHCNVVSQRQIAEAEKFVRGVTGRL